MKKPDFQIVSRRGIAWLRSSMLADSPRLTHAFSTRMPGKPGRPSRDFNLGFTSGASRSRIAANRRGFLGALGAEAMQLAEVHQIHSTLVMQVTRGMDGKLQYLPSGCAAPLLPRAKPVEGDALVTDEPGILLSVRAADCVPVLIADSRKAAVAAIHAGWKGMLGGIVEKTVGEMRRLFGTKPGNLKVAIGPSIRECCYEVGEELHSFFCGTFPEGEEFFRKPADERELSNPNATIPFLSFSPPGHGPNPAARLHLNLIAVARFQLRRAGVPASRISVAEYCTSCNNQLFFSHRKEGSLAGRMMAVIGILSGANRRSVKNRRAS